MTTSGESTGGNPEHAPFEDELGAYLDGELAGERVSALEAHLSGCGRCRTGLGLQRAMRERLGAEPVPPLPPGLQARLHTALRGLSASDAAQPGDDPLTSADRARPPSGRRPSWALGLAWGGWAVAAALALLLIFARTGSERARGSASVTASTRPQMVDAALLDYGGRIAEELPAPPALEELEARVGFAIRPLPNAQLVSAWVTSLRGEAVAALAYRADRLLVVQYVVSSGLFFRNPALRAAVDRAGHYVTEQGSTGIVCYPDEQSGTLLIGPAGADALLALASRN